MNHQQQRQTIHQTFQQAAQQETKTRRSRPNVISMPSGAGVAALPGAVGRPALWQRLGAELINCVVPWLLSWPLFIFPMWAVNGQQFILPLCLGGLALWHLLCDGAPKGPNPGKRLFRLRVVAASGLAEGRLWQKAARRLGSAVAHVLFFLILAHGLPAGSVEQQAHEAARILVSPFARLGYQGTPVTLLMLVVVLYVCQAICFAALTQDGGKLGDRWAATRVLTKASYNKQFKAVSK
jgi:uncharacterized RDD family membrane protein YckC